MKPLAYLLALMLSASQLTSFAQNKQKKMDTKKILAVYFSRPGNNYAVGNVATGNTQIVAEMIATETHASIFRIVPVKAYPSDYKACTEQARKEKDTKARPAVKGDIKVEDYGVIFIGYPNWWGDAPMPVYTFIEAHKWAGKTVIPFCTHEGSGLSNTAEIKAAVKGATMRDGLAVYGHVAQNEREKTLASVQKWLKKLGY